MTALNMVQSNFLPRFINFFIQANGIIKKLQGEVRGLVGKIKVKNTVTVSQEKILQETSEKLKNTEKDLQSAQQQIITKDEQVCLPIMETALRLKYNMYGSLICFAGCHKMHRYRCTSRGMLEHQI